MGVLMGEWSKLNQFSTDEPSLTFFAMTGGSFMAFTYNFVSFKFIQITSSVTHAIVGNLKLFAVVVLPALFIDHITSPTSWVGFSIFLTAALTYAYLEQRSKMAGAKAAASTTPADQIKPVSEET